MKKMNVTKSSMPSFEEYCTEIRDLWDNRRLTNMGIKHELFRQQLEMQDILPVQPSEDGGLDCLLSRLAVAVFHVVDLDDI